MSQFDYHCPNCQHRYSVHSTTTKGVENCPKCGQKDIVGKEAKYPALRTIAGFYKFLAYGMVVITIISFIVGFGHFVDSTIGFYDPKLGAILMLGSVVVGSITVITLLATSEGIMLFVNMANDLSEVKMSLDDQ